MVGEWLMQAHGTRYQLKHEPFVAFDLMFDIERARYDDLISRVKHGDFVTPTVIHRGRPLSIEAAMKMLKTDGFHGASDQVEGAYGELNETSWPIPARMASAFGGLISSSSMFVLTTKMTFTCRRSVAESQFGIGGEESTPSF